MKYSGYYVDAHRLMSDDSWVEVVKKSEGETTCLVRSVRQDIRHLRAERCQYSRVFANDRTVLITFPAPANRTSTLLREPGIIGNISIVICDLA